MSMYEMNGTEDVQIPKIGAGKSDNILLENIKYEPSRRDGTGNMVLRFNFKRKLDGAIFNHTEFEINVEAIKKWGGNTEENIKNQVKGLNERIAHILSQFVPKEKIVIKAISWEDYCKKVIEIAGKSFENILVRIKLVLNNAETHVTFPKRAITPFIQLMSVPDSIVINPEFDKIKPTIPTEETIIDNLEGNTKTESTLKF